MRIDAHQHFWNYNPSRDTWIDNSMDVLKNNFLPENLKPLLIDNSIEGCIAVQADESEEETSFLLDLADKNNLIKGVIGWINFEDPNFEQSLLKFSKNEKLKGIRHILQGKPKGFMLQNWLLNGISKLQEYKLTYDILIYQHQLKEAIQLVKKFPNQPFIIDHLAKPSIKNGTIDVWKNDITELANYKNVSCKLSGMFTEADLKNWKKKDFTPYFDVVFNEFKSDRILFGSDWPVCLLAANYKNTLTIVEDYIHHLPQKEQEAILGNNAIKFYNL